MPAGLSKADRLVWTLGHPDGDRAILAARALGRLGAHRAVPALRLVVETSADPYLAREALRSVLAIEGADTMHAWLVDLAGHAGFMVRQIAEEALSDGFLPVTDTATIYLVRHGRTALNAAGLLRGLADPALDPVGRAEARRVAELFAPIPLESVVASPLRRAIETATPIAVRAGLRVRIEDRLADRDYGPWTGRSREELESVWDTIDDAPEVEPASSVTSRVVNALEEIAASIGAGCAVVVAHDVVNRLALAHLTPSVGSDLDSIPQRTGCWNQLERTEDGWHLAVVDAIPGDGQTP
jgi:broad specificity phosphatase PhoE